MAISKEDLYRKMQMMDPYSAQTALRKYQEMMVMGNKIVTAPPVAETETNLLLLIEDESP